MSSRIAARYGKSLLQFAHEQKQIEEVCRDMKLLMETSEASKDFKSLLKSPIVSLDDKQKVFGKLFANFSSASSNFIAMVLQKKRESYLVDIARNYVELYNEEKGIAQASVLSAIPLSPQVMDHLKRYLSSVLKIDNVELENVIDGSVIGGMVVRYKDRLLDMSVARELKEMRNQLIYN